MRNRYHVVETRKSKVGRWFDISIVRSFKTEASAVRLADALARRSQWSTRYSDAIGRYGSGVMYEVAKDDLHNTVYECETTIVPSVGELGYW